MELDSTTCRNAKLDSLDTVMPVVSLGHMVRTELILSTRGLIYPRPPVQQPVSIVAAHSLRPIQSAGLKNRFPATLGPAHAERLSTCRCQTLELENNRVTKRFYAWSNLLS